MYGALLETDAAAVPRMYPVPARPAPSPHLPGPARELARDLLVALPEVRPP
jgi:hypothetical protein